ncbi:MAG: ketoacyl-ACP synthase III [Oscillospiraceae bacterium]|nr:ketoacyl-ACP synthase III [Oscillospiraceae bacterium]
MSLKQGIKILGTGSFKPNFVVKNADFTKYIDTTDEWIFTRTGISQRRYNIDGTTFSMASAAAERALASSNVSPEEIDMIIVATGSPDYFYPSCACLVQSVLGAKNACAVDISAACTGFVSALDMARSYLVVGKYKKILVIASESLSQQVDFTDRGTCVLFGDGAAAAVVEASDKTYASVLGVIADNHENPLLYCKVNYNNNSPFNNNSQFTIHNSQFINMDGKEVYKFAVDIMVRATEQACTEAGYALSEIDLLIPHQANIRIINTAMKNLDIPVEKVYVNIHDTGNISSACVPTCLDELFSSGRIKPGMKICMTAFGAGFTYGSIAMEV